jgi:gas vesicle protein
MKKVLLLIAALFGGAIIGAVAGVLAGLLMPAEKRAQLSQPFAAKIGQVLEQIPDQ